MGRGSPAEHWAHAEYAWLQFEDGDLQVGLVLMVQSLWRLCARLRSIASRFIAIRAQQSTDRRASHYADPLRLPLT